MRTAYASLLVASLVASGAAACGGVTPGERPPAASPSLAEEPQAARCDDAHVAVCRARCAESDAASCVTSGRAWMKVEDAPRATAAFEKACRGGVLRGCTLLGT